MVVLMPRHGLRGHHKPVVFFRLATRGRRFDSPVAFTAAADRPPCCHWVNNPACLRPLTSRLPRPTEMLMPSQTQALPPRARRRRRDNKQSLKTQHTLHRLSSCHSTYRGSFWTSSVRDMVSSSWTWRSKHTDHGKTLWKNDGYYNLTPPSREKWTDLARLNDGTALLRYRRVKSTRQNNNKCACTPRCLSN